MVITHNLMVFAMVPIVFGGPIVAGTVYRNIFFAHEYLKLLVTFSMIPIFCICYALIGVVDARLSVLWGFVCPHCGKPLYKSQSAYWYVPAVQETARCPKCNASII